MATVDQRFEIGTRVPMNEVQFEKGANREIIDAIRQAVGHITGGYSNTVLPPDIRQSVVVKVSGKLYDAITEALPLNGVFNGADISVHPEKHIPQEQAPQVA